MMDIMEMNKKQKLEHDLDETERAVTSSGRVRVGQRYLAYVVEGHASACPRTVGVGNSTSFIQSQLYIKTKFRIMWF